MKATIWRPPKDVPGEHAVRGLRGYDVAEAEGAGAEDDADERETERELVGDHLRGGAERAEQGVLVVGAPAGEGDAVDADGGDAEDDEEADVDVGDVEEVDALDAEDGAEGTTEMEMRAQESAMTGAAIKSGRSASRGVRSSLRKSLMPSARGCRRPKGPVREGPQRFCMRPRTLRSSRTV